VFSLPCRLETAVHLLVAMAAVCGCTSNAQGPGISKGNGASTEDDVPALCYATAERTLNLWQAISWYASYSYGLQIPTDFELLAECEPRSPSSVTDLKGAIAHYGSEIERRGYSRLPGHLIITATQACDKYIGLDDGPLKLEGSGFKLQQPVLNPSVSGAIVGQNLVLVVETKTQAAIDLNKAKVTGLDYHFPVLHGKWDGAMAVLRDDRGDCTVHLRRG
jgi:hypothetical protein